MSNLRVCNMEQMFLYLDERTAQIIEPFERTPKGAIFLYTAPYFATYSDSRSPTLSSNSLL